MNQPIPRRIPRKLKLGEYYSLKWDKWSSDKKYYQVRFIQPTEKGYNFLDLQTAKCLLKHHLYPSKHPEHTKKNETWFWINENLRIATI